MKKFFFAMLCVVSVLQMAAQSDFPKMFAHRGCWSKNASNEFIVPENSLPAVAMAKRMGYAGIECDVHYTKDRKMVILHDATLNRTMRRASDYSKLKEPVKLSDLTFEELRREYVLESENPEWRMPVPTLEELLEECRRNGIMPMLHSDLEESYRVAQKMFGNEWICFTGGVDHMLEVRKWSDCIILLAIDGTNGENHVENLKKIGGRCGISTMSYPLYTPEFCKTITDAGFEVQASIFPSPYEAIGQRNGITYQLTDFSIMPDERQEPRHCEKIDIRSDISSSNRIWRWNDAFECGGVVLAVEFVGKIHVTLNGNRTYTLVRDSMGMDFVGNRFFNIAPSVEIVVEDGASLKSAEIKLYEY